MLLLSCHRWTNERNLRERKRACLPVSGFSFASPFIDKTRTRARRCSTADNQRNVDRFFACESEMESPAPGIPPSVQEHKHVYQA